MHLRPWTKGWMRSYHLMENFWKIACNDGEENLLGFEKSPVFEDNDLRKKEAMYNFQWT